MWSTSAVAWNGAALGVAVLALGCGARTPLDDAPSTGSATGGATIGQAGGGGASSAGAGDATGVGGSGGASTCGDTQFDAANCGACGVKCNGDCQLGRCVLTFASGLQSAGCVAVDGESVYWVTGAPGPNFPGAVMKAPLGGGPVTTLASGDGFPWPCHIALDGANVYWGGHSADVGVRKVPLHGGAMTTVAMSGNATGGLAVDETSAYFTADYTDVSKVSLLGGAVGSLATSGGIGLAIDAQHVYWTVRNPAQATDVLSVPLAGGAVTTLASSLGLVEAIAVDARDVYVAEYSGGRLLALPVSGGPARLVASDLFTPQAIALDEQNVYWAGNGNLMKVPKTGGASTYLAVEAPQIFSIAVDASSVYWTNGDAVRKASKR